MPARKWPKRAHLRKRAHTCTRCANNVGTIKREPEARRGLAVFDPALPIPQTGCMADRGASRNELKVLVYFVRRYGSDLYGLEIADHIGLPSRKTYPILAKLEARGWIEAEWEQADPRKVGRRPRRYYRLTPNGYANAKREVEDVFGGPLPLGAPSHIARLLALGGRGPR